MNSLVKQFTKSAITINKNLFTKYIRLNSSSSKQSTADDSIPNQTEEGDQDIERIIKVAPPVRPLNEPLSIKRARLLYSSRKRGILETDLLLSTFSQKNLETMNAEQLADFDTFMEENDWDIYYWLTGAKVPPMNIMNMEIFGMLVEHSKNKERTILRMPHLH